MSLYSNANNNCIIQNIFFPNNNKKNIIQTKLNNNIQNPNKKMKKKLI